MDNVLIGKAGGRLPQPLRLFLAECMGTFILLVRYTNLQDAPVFSVALEVKLHQIKLRDLTENL